MERSTRSRSSGVYIYKGRVFLRYSSYTSFLETLRLTLPLHLYRKKQTMSARSESGTGDSRSDEEKKVDTQLAERLSNLIEDANKRVVPLCKMIRKVSIRLIYSFIFIRVLIIFTEHRRIFRTKGRRPGRKRTSKTSQTTHRTSR